MRRQFAAPHESVSGTSLPFAALNITAAFGGRADLIGIIAGRPSLTHCGPRPITSFADRAAGQRPRGFQTLSRSRWSGDMNRFIDADDLSQTLKHRSEGRGSTRRTELGPEQGDAPTIPERSRRPAHVFLDCCLSATVRDDWWCYICSRIILGGCHEEVARGGRCACWRFLGRLGGGRRHASKGAPADCRSGSHDSFQLDRNLCRGQRWRQPGDVASEQQHTPIFGSDSFSSSPRLVGAVGGGQAGFNWQFYQWVVGVEADIQATSERKTQAFTIVQAVGGARSHRL
jgi:hypothetical protein